MKLKVLKKFILLLSLIVIPFHEVVSVSRERAIIIRSFIQESKSVFKNECDLYRFHLLTSVKVKRKNQFDKNKFKSEIESFDLKYLLELESFHKLNDSEEFYMASKKLNEDYKNEAFIPLKTMGDIPLIKSQSKLFGSIPNFIKGIWNRNIISFKLGLVEKKYQTYFDNESPLQSYNQLKHFLSETSSYSTPVLVDDKFKKAVYVFPSRHDHFYKLETNNQFLSLSKRVFDHHESLFLYGYSASLPGQGALVYFKYKGIQHQIFFENMRDSTDLLIKVEDGVIKSIVHMKFIELIPFK